jgi:hypothetical protein
MELFPVRLEQLVVMLLCLAPRRFLMRQPFLDRAVVVLLVLLLALVSPAVVLAVPGAAPARPLLPVLLVLVPSGVVMLLQPLLQPVVAAVAVVELPLVWV